MIRVWSDTHFNHRSIIEHAYRPDASVDEMNGRLIRLWNAETRPDDDVFFLGDFGFEKGTPLAQIFEQLAGRKHLVRGNHDLKNKKVLRLPWVTINDYHETKEQTAPGVYSRAVLMHYPLESWNRMHYGAIHAHGHCHGNLKRQINHRFDVGVDSLGSGGPIPLASLFAQALTQPFESVDHHGRGEE